ncbi:hypothetical protein EDB89DRAFT_2080212 [Lactarius sanguifluus]|nr:hypothetical protein EDB89DRAFT_2080212 [Lactarius sanguifluus]
MAMKSSYTSRLIDLILEMANSFLHLLQTQKRSLSLPRRYAGPSENVRCPACPDVLTEPELKLWSKPVPRNVVVPMPAPGPAPVLAFKNFSFSLLPSSPKPTHRAREGGARLRVDLQRVKRRRGGSDVDRGGSTLLVAEVEDREEDDNGDMLVDQVIEADAVTAAPRSLVLAFCDRDPLHAIGQLQPSVNLSAIAVTRTLVLFFVFIRAPQAVPRVVLQVTRAGMRLPDDLPCFERLCSRTVGRPVKDMIREELDQEQDFNDDLDLDSDSDVDDEDSIIARIQVRDTSFLGENDDTLRAKDRKQRNRIFRAVHDGKFEVVLNNFIDSSPSTYPTPLSTANRSLRRPIRAHDEARQQGAKQPDRRWRSSASRWSSDTSGASVEDLRSAPTLSLLPMARYAPKSVRELPRAFSLKSMSEGNGGARFTKLVKTMLSSIRADDRNVVRILVKPPHGKGKRKAGRMKTTRKMAKS